MRILIAATVALVLGFLPASAADTYSRQQSVKDSQADVAVVDTSTWSGLYAGGQIGYGNTVISSDDGQGGIALSGLAGGLRLGGDLQRDMFVAGIWGEYNWTGHEISSGSDTLLEQTSDWSVNARLGLAHGKTLFYGLVGYGGVHVESFDDEEDLGQFRIGGGIEHKLSESFSLSLEYVHSILDADDVADGAEDFVDVNEDRVWLVGKFRFGAPRTGLFE